MLKRVIWCCHLASMFAGWYRGLLRRKAVTNSPRLSGGSPLPRPQRRPATGSLHHPRPRARTHPSASSGVHHLLPWREPRGCWRTTGDRATAVFRPWPIGDTGLYSARVNFEEAGQWRAEVAVTPPGEAARTVQGYFRSQPEELHACHWHRCAEECHQDGGGCPLVGTVDIVAQPGAQPCTRYP